VSNLTFWLMVGFLGQAFFTARFLVQWVVSERKRDSVVPVAFWWLSLAGGAALLSYAISRRDPVIIVGQGMGLVVYTRNLMLVGKARRQRSLVGCSASTDSVSGQGPCTADRFGEAPRYGPAGSGSEGAGKNLMSSIIGGSCSWSRARP
jgi:lipid-A-disaccharide synthase-like uncharacterized protein